MKRKNALRLVAPASGPVSPEPETEVSTTRAEFWAGVPALVTSKVRTVQGRDINVRRPVIEYLRDLESVARSECDSRETVQVIASGRRLLGDKAELAPGDGPFSRT